MTEERAPTFGEYECETLLGQGGMGSVWLARGRDGQQVALKTVARSDPRLLRRFRREILTLKRLEHPGVVRCLDDGEQESGQPWYVMPLLKGATLLRFMHTIRALSSGLQAHHSRSTKPQDLGLASTHWLSRLSQMHSTSWAHTLDALPLLNREDMGGAQGAGAQASWSAPTTQKVLGWLGQICQTLDYVHGQGVVHCDLKPENILITEDGQAILVDFGIADVVGARIEQGDLEAAGLQAGTTHYISPEQIQGHGVDARTDLYSMGCMMYEAIAARVPFDDPSSDNVLRQHLFAHAQPLQTCAPDTPQEVGRVVESLLAKTPQERVGHARVVREVLMRHGVGVPVWEQAPAARATLYRPEFTGRAQTLKALADGIERLHQPPKAVPLVLLGGESGVGKSRLVAQVIATHRTRALEVLHGQGIWRDGQREADPLHVFESALRQMVEVCRDDPPRAQRVFGRWYETLAPYAPFLSKLDHILDTGERAAVARAEPAHTRLFEAMGEVLCAFVEDRATLLVLDDLHWADHLSLGVVDHIHKLGQANRVRVMVLGTYRTESLPYQLALLRQREDVLDVRLERFAPEQVRELMCQMLGMHEVPQEIASFVSTQTEGNPYYVAEYLRMMLDEDMLSLSAMGRWTLRPQEERVELGALAVPERVNALVHGRVARLPPHARHVAQAAAVLGRSCKLEILHQMLQSPREAVANHLDMLRRHDVLWGDEQRVRFAHDKLRRAVLESMDEAQRRALHARAASVWAARPHSRLGRLGHHWERAGQRAEAVAAYEADAMRALGRGDVEGGAQMLARAIALEHEVDDARHRAHVEMIERTWLTPERAAQASVHLEALSARALNHQDGLLRAQTQLVLAEAYRLSADPTRARRVLQEATSRYTQYASGQGQAKAALMLARLEADAANWGVAKGLCEDAYARYRSLRDDKGQALSLMLSGRMSRQQGKFVEAASSFETAQRLYQRAGDRVGVADVMVWRSWIHWELGQWGDARAWGEAAHDKAQELGHSRLVVIARLGLSGLSVEQHRTEDARAWLALSSQALSFHDDPNLSAHHHLIRAQLEGQSGRMRAWEDALGSLARVKSHLEPPAQAMGTMQHAMHAHLSGDAALCAALHAQWLRERAALAWPKRARVVRAHQVYARVVGV